jgi:hypothetical protein
MIKKLVCKIDKETMSEQRKEDKDLVEDKHNAAASSSGSCADGEEDGGREDDNNTNNEDDVDIVEEEIDSNPAPRNQLDLQIIPSPNRSPLDVLCGRGLPFQKYPGNLHMHEVVERHKNEYNVARRSDKPRVVKRIIQEIRDTGARFLRPYGEFNSNDQDLWVEADDDIVYDKISHVLRHRKKAVGGGAVGSEITKSGGNNQSTHQDDTKPAAITKSEGQSNANIHSAPPLSGLDMSVVLRQFPHLAGTTGSGASSSLLDFVRQGNTGISNDEAFLRALSLASTPAPLPSSVTNSLMMHPTLLSASSGHASLPTSLQSNETLRQSLLQPPPTSTSSSNEALIRAMLSGSAPPGITSSLPITDPSHQLQSILPAPPYASLQNLTGSHDTLPPSLLQAQLLIQGVYGQGGSGLMCQGSLLGGQTQFSLQQLVNQQKRGVGGHTAVGIHDNEKLARLLQLQRYHDQQLFSQQQQQSGATIQQLLSSQPQHLQARLSSSAETSAVSASLNDEMQHQVLLSYLQKQARKKENPK